MAGKDGADSMTYIQGFVTPVPVDGRDAYRDHSRAACALLKEFGALRLVEAWGYDVPVGKINDFHGAVQRRPEEAVVFSWIEYPDRAACDAAVEKMMTDPRMADLGDMPFDGKRMIYGGFNMFVDEGPRGPMAYVDGFVLAVPDANRDAYGDFARTVFPMFRDHGVTRYVGCWGDNVSRGETTDFYRAVHAAEGESIVFAWCEWPDKAARDAGMAAIIADERMATPPADMPFDGKRMIFGGFAPILDP
jgi:uncharacterized protein YbaA (DUF1428 family)